MVAEEVVALSPPAQLDSHKRKLDDLETDAPPPSDQSEEEEEQVAVKDGVDASDAKRPRVDDSAPEGLGGENGYQNGKEDVAQERNPQIDAEALEEDQNLAEEDQTLAEEAPIKETDELSVEEREHKVDSQQDVQLSSSTAEQLEDAEKPSEKDPEPAAAEMPHNLCEQSRSADDSQPTTKQNLSESGNETISRRMEVPNNMVGVLIGKAGETIRNLQYNSGAKIQITRDVDADPGAATRPVDLIGTVSSINTAEKLMKEVMAEADAGGSPALVARGFALASGVMEQIQMQIPNDKVGLIIGKGGETIKNLQTKSSARIQLLPHHLADGDNSKERTLRVSGDKKQIDNARELIKEAMNQNVKQSTSMSNYGQQQGFRPRGPPGATPQWGPPRNTPPASYDYQQHRGGPYPSQTQQYSSYGGFPPQGPQRGSYGAGWEQRPPMQGPHNPSGGYNYYGGQSNARPSAPHPSQVPPASSMGYNMPSHAQANYNYGQPPYSQTQPSHQGYSQAATQQPYGGQYGSSQPGSYQDAQGYPNQQQQYPPAPFNAPSQGAPPAQSYPATQYGAGPYQAPASAAPSYGQNIPAQQPYPYGSVPTTTNDGYSQPQPAGASSYPQQGGSQPVAGYTQPGVQQQAPAYSQAYYGQYPPAQQGYVNQATAASYGYQAQADPSAYAAAGQAYSSAPPAAAQTGYAQPAPNQASYDQSVPQQPGAYPAPAAAAAAAALAPAGTQPAAAYPQQ